MWAEVKILYTMLRSLDTNGLISKAEYTQMRAQLLRQIVPAESVHSAKHFWVSI
jgi:hypothetical protein